MSTEIELLSMFFFFLHRLNRAAARRRLSRVHMCRLGSCERAAALQSGRKRHVGRSLRAFGWLLRSYASHRCPPRLQAPAPESTGTLNLAMSPTGAFRSFTSIFEWFSTG